MTLDPDTKQETDRLMRVIAALSAASEALGQAGRRLAPAADDANGLFNALLSELEETVLRRTLRFQAGQGRTLALDVAERRVLRVLSCKGVDAFDSQSLEGRFLTTNDTAEFAPLLTAFCSHSGKISVISDLPGKDLAVPFEGVSVDELRRHLQALRDDTAQPSPFQDVITDLKDNSVALICLAENAEDVLQGDDANLASLAALVPLLSEQEGDVLQIWSGDLQDDTAVVAARRGTSVLVALIAFDTLDDLLRSLFPGGVGALSNPPQ